MTEKDRSALGKELTQTATRSSVAASLATLAGQRPEMIIAAALSQFVPFVAGLVFGVAWNAKKGSAERWWARILEDMAATEGTTVEEAEERLRARAEEPAVRDAIFRSLRALLDAVDDAATLPLARLVSDYQRSSTPPDPFFRGAARLLSELSAPELADLTRLVRWARQSCTAPKFTLVALDRDSSQGPNEADWPIVPWKVLIFITSGKLNEPDHSLSGLMDPSRLLFLLQVNGLARTSTHIGWMGIDPMKVDIEQASLERLDRILFDAAAPGASP